jgi:amino acid adenylation domain-containing protein
MMKNGHGPAIHRFFEARAQAHPDQILVDGPGGQLSYAEVDARATALAARLQSLGVTAAGEPIVAVWMEASPEALISILAIWKAGAAYLPLDPNGPVRRLARMIDRTRARAILTRGSVAAATLEPLLAAGRLAAGAVLDVDAPPASGHVYRPESVDGTHLAYVFFTSGSTGMPKGVMVEHRQVWNCLDWMQEAFPLDRSSTIVQRTPLTFDPSVWEMFWPATHGATVRFLAPGKSANPAYLVRLLESAGSKLSAMYVPASMLAAMTQVLAAAPRRRLMRLPLLFIGAEPVRRSVIDAFYGSFEGQIVNTYGPTECTINNSFYEVPRQPSRSPVPIGRAIKNNRIHVVSSEGLPLPDGETGELWIEGRSVGRGYIADPEMSARAFVGASFAGGVLYRTGDLGRVAADGNIEFLGRTDDQVKIRGHRVELGEIEAALCDHPAIAECVVIATELDSPRCPSSGPRLTACYVSKTAPPDVLELRYHLRRYLSPQMIPGAFVAMDSLPLTGHGKIDRKALAERIAPANCGTA